MGSPVNASFGWMTSVWKKRCSTGPFHRTSGTGGADVVVAAATVVGGTTRGAGLDDRGLAAPELQLAATSAPSATNAIKVRGRAGTFASELVTDQTRRSHSN